MPSTSLRSRVVAIGMGVLDTVVVVASVTLYATQRVVLERHLQEVLTDRVEVVRDFADDGRDPAELAAALGLRGIRAVLVTIDGQRLDTDPAFPRVGTNLPVPAGTDEVSVVSREIELADGTRAIVSVSRDGIDEALRRLLAALLSISTVAVPVAWWAMRRGASAALRPLDDLVATASDIAAGDHSRRLAADGADPETELGRAAAAFDRMLDEVQASAARATEAAASTRRFLDTTAHQLKTPIAAAAMSVDALVRETDPVTRDELLLVASRETTRAGRLVANLLRLAQIDDQREIACRPTNVTALVTDEVARAQRRAPHLVLSLQAGDEVTASANGEATAEIIANLLDNATRHAQEAIEVTVSRREEGAQITVVDDGPGIAADQAPYVFDRFVSLDGRGGSGLGLAIARELADAQDGHLEFSAGRFVLRLPTPRHGESVTA